MELLVAIDALDDLVPGSRRVPLTAQVPHAAPWALEQAHAGLALEHRELLRDGRRREPQGVGDRGDRPALVQLAQQSQAAEVEHRAATLSPACVNQT